MKKQTRLWKTVCWGVLLTLAFAFVGFLIVGLSTKTDSNQVVTAEEPAAIVVIQPMVDNKDHFPTTSSPAANTNVSVTPNSGLAIINLEDFFKEPYPNLLYRGWTVAPLNNH